METAPSRRASMEVKLNEGQEKTIREIITVLSQDHKSRDDGEYLVNRLSVLQYFNSFVERYMRGTQHDSIVKICRCMKLEHRCPGTILFTEGERSNNKLYIIVEGCIVLMKRNSYELNGQQRSRRNNTLLFSVMNHVNATVEGPEQEINTGSMSEFMNQYGNILRVLGQGEGFGEKSLLENKARTLTAIVQDATTLIILEKKDFDLVRDAFEHQIKYRKDLLFNLFQDVLNEYSTTRLEQMAYSFKSHEYEKGQMLMKAGDRSDIFYLLEEGEIQISAQFDKYFHQFMLAPGQFIGEEIVINKSSEFDFTGVVVSVSASVLIISKGVFFSQFPMECRNSVIQTYEQKRHVRLLNQNKYQNNENVQSLRQHYSSRSMGYQEIRNLQLKTWQNHVIDTDQTYRQFELDYKGTPTTDRMLEQLRNRQAVNMVGIREKQRVDQARLHGTKMLKFKKISAAEPLEDWDWNSSMSVRKERQQHVLDVNQIVESSNFQFQKKLTDQLLNGTKNYGFFVHDEAQIPTNLKDDIKSKMSKDVKKIESSTTEVKINPKSRLDFGRGDIERQLRKEHFFQILKSQKPVKMDYMDHDFHILKSVISQRFKRAFRHHRAVQPSIRSTASTSKLSPARSPAQATSPPISLGRVNSFHNTGILFDNEEYKTIRVPSNKDSMLYQRFIENQQLHRSTKSFRGRLEK